MRHGIVRNNRCDIFKNVELHGISVRYTPRYIMFVRSFAGTSLFTYIMNMHRATIHHDYARVRRTVATIPHNPLLYPSFPRHFCD